MAKTSVLCPNCHQPITIELTRLFDMNTDPQAKEKLLSGSANYFQCPVCKYQGVYPTPIVYHDPDKELLLTYFPPEAGLPVPEQERIVGPLIKKVVDDLPNEKRKAYIFRPQSMLTQQRLFETILEADGITPEMMKAQQEKLALIQQLAQARPDTLPTLIEQNDAKIDEELFVLLSRLGQASAAQGDQKGAELLMNLQKAMLEHSTFGRQAAAEAQETQEAIQELQQLSKAGLTRENLLELLIKSSDSDVRLTTIATMARGGLDYTFFQLLSEKIEAAKDPEKQKLTDLRSRLLTITDEVDQALKAQADDARKLLDELLKAEDTVEATQAALPRFTNALADLINSEARAAQEANDDAKLKKLVTIVSVLQAANKSSLAIDLIDTLLDAPDADAREAVYAKSANLIDQDFLQMLGGLISQIETAGNQPEVLAKLKEINREAMRFSMTKNLKRSQPA